MKSDYEQVARAIRFIQRHVPKQPSLQDIANHIDLSPYYCQRLFSRWAEGSPERFLQVLTVGMAKQFLRESMSVWDAAYEPGLSSPARINRHFVSLDAVTPGEYKQQGAGLNIQYGIHPSPFGSMFLAITARGICFLAFLGSASRHEVLYSFQHQWQKAKICEASSATAEIARSIFAPSDQQNNRLNVLVRGSNFQIKVWQALLMIPEGSVCSYEQIAYAIDHPGASRPVGHAAAMNPVAYLIPCHRVIRKTGETGEYRWGDTRKRAILAWEMSRTAFDADK